MVGHQYVWNTTAGWLGRLGDTLGNAYSALVAGEAHIGEVGGKTALVTDGFTRPADTTAYTAKDAVSAATLAVAGATNASPIVITCNNHGLVTGDAVTIASVGGNTAANGDFLVTRITANTFSLDGSTGNGAYTSGGAITRLGRLASIGRVNGGSGYITKVRLVTDLKTEVSAYRVWFYGTQPSVIADNSPFTLLWANRTKRMGYVDLPALSTEDATNSTCAAQQNIIDRMAFVCGASSRDLYYQVEVLSAPTPTSAQGFYLEVAAELN